MSFLDGGYIPRLESSGFLKPKETSAIVSVRLTPSEVRELDWIVMRGEARSRGAAIRMLLRKALLASESKDTANLEIAKPIIPY